jgi:dGTPase
MPELAGRVADAFAARIRELEEHALSPLAVRSYGTRGRERAEDECSVRTPFQRDRDRILHSKPFRRLKGKTQVFIDPAGDHYRTRMTHTLETTGIARVVARALQLNEDLTEAIGLGHDMGHPPFGHAGEAVLDELLRENGGDGFRHNEQSARIAAPSASSSTARATSTMAAGDALRNGMWLLPSAARRTIISPYEPARVVQ